MNTQLLYAESQSSPSQTSGHPASRQPHFNPHHMMICLSVCMALQMTSFVMILPLFARRFSALGAGVSALGVSEMAYAFAATIAAPFMGALSDRYGRRPFILGPMVVYTLAFTGYLLASSAQAFIYLRGVAGALTAGLMPAATGMVADLAPADRRGQWIGILSGGASIGWIAGPILGGYLYDHWGYDIALIVAIGMAALAFTTALVSLRETHLNRTSHAPETPTQHETISFRKFTASLRAFRAELPTSLRPLGLVLFTSFAVMFAWAFIEPRFMFYAYDDLGWNSSMLGLMMSTYGISLMLGEFGLSRLSDRFGRKPLILIGLVLFSAQFTGLALSRNYLLIAIAFVIAGLGNALYDPALSASILDMAPASQQARLLGLRSTAASIGNILGPALVVLCTPLLQAQGIFLATSGIVFLILLITLSFGSGVKPDKAPGLSPNALNKKEEVIP